jgi:hypothetical protein
VRCSYRACRHHRRRALPPARDHCKPMPLSACFTALVKLNWAIRSHSSPATTPQKSRTGRRSNSMDGSPKVSDTSYLHSFVSFIPSRARWFFPLTPNDTDTQVAGRSWVPSSCNRRCLGRGEIGRSARYVVIVNFPFVDAHVRDNAVVRPRDLSCSMPAQLCCGTRSLRLVLYLLLFRRLAAACSSDLLPAREDRHAKQR